MFLALLHELPPSCHRGYQAWIGAGGQIEQGREVSVPSLFRLPCDQWSWGPENVLPSFDQKVIFEMTKIKLQKKKSDTEGLVSLSLSKKKEIGSL